jgi:hypothetical protein
VPDDDNGGNKIDIFSDVSFCVINCNGASDNDGEEGEGEEKEDRLTIAFFFTIAHVSPPNATLPRHCKGKGKYKKWSSCNPARSCLEDLRHCPDAINTSPSINTMSLSLVSFNLHSGSYPVLGPVVRSIQRSWMPSVKNLMAIRA